MKIYLRCHWTSHETHGVHLSLEAARAAQDPHREDIIEWDTDTQESVIVEDE